MFLNRRLQILLGSYSLGGSVHAGEKSLNSLLGLGPKTQRMKVEGREDEGRV